MAIGSVGTGGNQFCQRATGSPAPQAKCKEFTEVAATGLPKESSKQISLNVLPCVIHPFVSKRGSCGTEPTARTRFVGTRSY